MVCKFARSTTKKVRYLDKKVLYDLRNRLEID
jgi:hypothetical protein